MATKKTAKPKAAKPKAAKPNGAKPNGAKPANSKPTTTTTYQAPSPETPQQQKARIADAVERGHKVSGLTPTEVKAELARFSKGEATVLSKSEAKSESAKVINMPPPAAAKKQSEPWHPGGPAPEAKKPSEPWLPGGKPPALTPPQAYAKKQEKPAVLGPLQSVLIDSAQLKAALACAAKDANRNARMAAVHFRTREQRLELVATDGKVLMVQTVALRDLPKWGDEGATFDREVLDQAVKIAGKGGDMRLSFGENHTHAQIEIGGWATLRARVIEGMYVNYADIVASSGDALAGGEVAPLDTSTGLSPDNMKQLLTVAAALEVPSVLAHLSQRGAGSPNVYTFGPKVNAVVYIMPTKLEAPMSATTALMLAPAMARTAAALKAHITRNVEALKKASGREAQQLEARVVDLRARLVLCTPQLEDKTKSAKKK